MKPIPLMADRPRSLIDRLLHQQDGPLTRDLLLNPGGFGLGHVPARQTPDAVTNMTCGFCSTGGSLTVHLKEGEAVNLTPTAGHCVNQGMACPKGWEALNVLKAADRATSPLLREASGRRRSVDWPEAMRVFCEDVRDREGVSHLGGIRDGVEAGANVVTRGLCISDVSGCHIYQPQKQ